MIQVFNPADGSIVGEAPMMRSAEVKQAIDRTCAAGSNSCAKTGAPSPS
jgi:succinate-semialdehyde dehydrogenase/glutarate-semialdehyde dehydrogenase